MLLRSTKCYRRTKEVIQGFLQLVSSTLWKCGCEKKLVKVLSHMVLKSDRKGSRVEELEFNSHWC